MIAKNLKILDERRTSITDELLKALQNSTTIERFINEHDSDYNNMGFNEYLISLLKKKKLKKVDIISASNLSKVYVYQIFAGIKNPSRDKLLALAFAMKLSLDECQKLLYFANVNELYVRNKRDSIIIFGLIKGLNNMEINILLYEMEEFILQ